MADKQEKTPEDIENEILAELESKKQKLNTLENQKGDPIQLLKIVLEKPPVKSNKIPVDQFLTKLKELTDNEVITLYDYLNKSFQIYGEGGPQANELKVSSNQLLAIHEKIIECHGKSVILKSISKRRTLVTRPDNFEDYIVVDGIVMEKQKKK